MHNNDEISKILYDFANRIEGEGGNIYRARAYRKAARSISLLNSNLNDLILEGYDITKISYVGKGIANVIKSIVLKGSLPTVSKTKFPIYNELKQIPGIGKKRLNLLNQINIHTREELKNAIQNGSLNTVKGFNKSLEIKLLKNLYKKKKNDRFFKLFYVYPIAVAIVNYLKTYEDILKVECVGSFRRKKEAVRNLDIIVSIKSRNSHLLNYFLNFHSIKEIVLLEKNKCSVVLESGVFVNLYFIPIKKFGIKKFIMTGSKSHIKNIKKIAKTNLVNLNKIETQEEVEIYKLFHLPLIAPELREDRGEILAARINHLPNLINLNDIKGDLHSHTDATDGYESIDTMARAAEELGYEYLAITDHSQRLTIAKGLNKKRLWEQIKLIDKLNNTLNIRILKGIEVDILEDGSLDFSDDILKELDIRVCSIHSLFRLPKKKQTERILRAMDNPFFNILGHPTGRLIYSRKPYELDLMKIFQAAIDRKCFLEINSQPARLDLNDEYCKIAKEMGARFAISSDAHSSQGLKFMQYGIYQARRGWLEANDVINTCTLNQLLRLLKRN